jgi:hypothetical protein
MNFEQNIAYFLKKDSIQFIQIYFTTMFFIIIVTFLLHCCYNKKPNLIDYKRHDYNKYDYKKHDYKKHDYEKDDDVSSSTQDEIVDGQIDTSEENYSSVFYESLNLMTKKQLLRIIGVRFRNLNKDQIITMIMGKLIINAVENNIYITKESKNFIRENEKKMESEFFSLYDIKNIGMSDFNETKNESDTDAVLGTSDNDSSSDIDSFDDEKTT